MNRKQRFLIAKLAELAISTATYRAVTVTTLTDAGFAQTACNNSQIVAVAQQS